MESGLTLTGFRGRHREFQGPISLGFNILGANFIGAIFSGGRLHLKAAVIERVYSCDILVGISLEGLFQLN